MNPLVHNVLLSLFLSLIFISCQDDAQPLRVKTLEMIDPTSKQSINSATFSYDDGQLSSIQFASGETYVYHFYTDSVAAELIGTNNVACYTLQDGLITRFVAGEKGKLNAGYASVYTLTYSQGKLLGIDCNGHQYFVTWDGDNIASIEDDFQRYLFSYDSKQNPVRNLMMMQLEWSRIYFKPLLVYLNKNNLVQVTTQWKTLDVADSKHNLPYQYILNVPASWQDEVLDWDIVITRGFRFTYETP